MKTATIEELAYFIKEAKQENRPGPIVFLGAGASKSGGIPLASEIVLDILDRYKDNPSIITLAEKDRNYPNLMECLAPFQRNQLLKKYIDEARINVTHIYIAQLLNAGFIDYVLTVNFDNLMLRALALYNVFPPTYDMAILKDLTTTSFNEGSVLYLHGQHHGLWLLNTAEELEKVREIIPPIFNKITNQRPWIFIGYSGEDPIFEHVIKLGRFDNGLYWVCYKDGTPGAEVCASLLDKPNTNSFIVRGYDSDSFMLRLNEELELGQPAIIDKPFTSLRRSLDNIVDINDEKHSKGVKERLEIVKNQVATAIRQFEQGAFETSEELNREAELDQFKKRIIEEIIKGDFTDSTAETLIRDSKAFDSELVDQSLANLFFSWGNKIHEESKLKGDKDLYLQSLEKYEKAAEFNPTDHSVFNNWGNTLSNLAELKGDEDLYLQSLEKFEKAAELNPKYDYVFNNWGSALSNLAKLKGDEDLHLQSLEKFEKAAELNPKYDYVFYNWGTALSNLAELKGDEDLYLQSLEKYEKAAELNPKYDPVFYNWGNSLSNLAKLKGDEDLYLQSLEKYEKAAELNSKDHSVFNNWGTALSNLAELKGDEDLYLQSFEKYEKAAELNPTDDYVFNNWGSALSNLAKLKGDEDFYLQSLEKYEKAAQLNPTDDHVFNNWGSALSNLAKLKGDKDLYLQSLEKYEKAAEFNPTDYSVFNNWGTALSNLARLKGDQELLTLSISKFLEGVELGGKSYNLSCTYALIGNRLESLKYLERSLDEGEITAEFVKNDNDWINFRSDPDYLSLIEKYKG